MDNLFMTYLERFDKGGSSQQEASQVVIDVDDDNDFSVIIFVREVATQIQRITNILAIQISSVASESAFSTCGRVVSEYQTSLSTL
uniref:HAT C-terminal dimerisation domain-containing protein n=1 Tax=Lactuca sativa TaxID=4236 RepID=A0A9R1VWZ7_LACSA|nr:hypothetical protein LSAT_V11C400174980 [Lactuca sativa]